MNTIAHQFLLALTLASLGFAQASVELTPEGQARVSWPFQSDPGLRLQYSSDLTNWTETLDLPEVSNDLATLSQTALHEPAGRMFYRLQERAPDIYDIPTSPPPGGQPQVITLIDQGQLRRYFLYLPSTYSAPPVADRHCDDGYPLAIICHGSGQTASSFLSMRPDLLSQCNSREVILVVPQGTINTENLKPSWNSSDDHSRRDDALFIQRLIASLKQTLWIDRDRIYLGGFSNGGVFAQQAASRSPGNFTAICAIAAALGGQRDASSPLIRIPEPLYRNAVPTMIVNGRRDTARPWDGGLSNGDGPYVTPVAEMHDFWHTALRCQDPLTSVNIPGPGATPAGREESACLGTDQEVRFIDLRLMDHRWPDANDNFGWDASHEVIDFFLSHQRGAIADEATPEPVIVPSFWQTSQFTGSQLLLRIPRAPSALVMLFHPAGSDRDFARSLEMVTILETLVAEGIGFVSISSEDQVTGTWDITDPSADTNKDLERAATIYHAFINIGDIPAGTRVVPMGFGAGGQFAALAAESLPTAGVPIGGRALLNTPLPENLPATVADALETSEQPIHIATGENDSIAGVIEPWAEYRRAALYGTERQRQFSSYFPGRRKTLLATRIERVPAVTPGDGQLAIQELIDAGYIDAADNSPTICPDSLDLDSIPVPTGYTAEEETQIREQICAALSGHTPDSAGAGTLRSFVIGARADDSFIPPPVPAAAPADTASTAPVPAVPWTFSGNFQGLPVRAYIPPAPRAVVYFFHGTTGGIDFYERLEQREMIHALHAIGIGTVGTVSTDRDNRKKPGARWDSRSHHPVTDEPYLENIDFTRLMALRDMFIGNGDFNGTTPLCAMGFSNGGGFALTFAYLAQQSGIPIAGISVHAQGGSSPGPYRASRRLDNATPIFLTVLANDDVAPRIPPLRDMLTALGHTVTYHEGIETRLTPQRFLRIPGVTQQSAQNYFDRLVTDGTIDPTGLRKIELNQNFTTRSEEHTRQVRAVIKADHLFTTQFLTEEINWFDTLVP